MNSLSKTKLLFLSLLCLIGGLIWLSAAQTFPGSAPALIGAWEMESESYAGHRTIASFSPDYFVVSRYHLENKQFDMTMGGTYESDGDSLALAFEFHTRAPERVGQTLHIHARPESDDQMIFSFFDENGEGQVHAFKRIDDGDAPLAGAWNFHARRRNGELQERRPGPRKTVKMLTGTRFQWIAFNTETRAFSGTGGGTYTFDDGVYTEHIEFFSRDSTRVGASLSFEGRVEGNEWHHSGKSSKGQPMYEIWRRE